MSFHQGIQAQYQTITPQQYPQQQAQPYQGMTPQQYPQQQAQPYQYPQQQAQPYQGMTPQQNPQQQAQPYQGLTPQQNPQQQAQPYQGMTPQQNTQQQAQPYQGMTPQQNPQQQAQPYQGMTPQQNPQQLQQQGMLVNSQQSFLQQSMSLQNFPALQRFLAQAVITSEYATSAWKYIDACYSLIPEDFLFKLFYSTHCLFIPTMMNLKNYLKVDPPDRIPETFTYCSPTYKEAGYCRKSPRFCSMFPVDQNDRVFGEELMHIHHDVYIAEYIQLYEKLVFNNQQVMMLYSQTFPYSMVKNVVFQKPENVSLNTEENDRGGSGGGSTNSGNSNDVVGSGIHMPPIDLSGIVTE